MNDGPAYALLDRDGELLTLVDSAEEAEAIAHEVMPGASLYIDAPIQGRSETEHELLAANAGEVVQLGEAKVRKAPEIALAAVAKAMSRPSGLLIDLGEVLAIDRDEAWERLLPYFPTRRGNNQPVKAYQTPQWMTENLLGQNYKTAKGTPRLVHSLVREASMRAYGLSQRQSFADADVLGLSLLPHSMGHTDENVQEIVHEKRYRFPRLAMSKVNVCTRATAECRSSCLVFSGRNLADDYNTVKKYSLLQALMADPVAFGRMLFEAIERHRRISLQNGILPLIRLNVFSDLPWEAMFPGLFEHFSEGERFVQFYDYTKVPARIVPENYDLTFSFAGSKQNVEDMDFEVRQNRRRVAVVFARVGERPIRGGGRMQVPMKTRAGPRGLPQTFMGLKVIDGDVSDMRPFDPSPCIVALRWKNPRSQGVTLEEADLFIVKGAMVSGHFIVAETPRHTRDYSAFAD